MYSYTYLYPKYKYNDDIQDKTLYIYASELNLRASADIKAVSIGTIKRGDSVVCIRRTNENFTIFDKQKKEIQAPYFFVRDSKGNEGWIFAYPKYVSFTSPTQEDIEFDAPKIIIGESNPTTVASNGSTGLGSYLMNAIRSPFQKQDHEQLKTACDYLSTEVQELSKTIAGRSRGEYNIGQVCRIFDHCRKSWRYVSDADDFPTEASSTIRNGLNGDCDDYAALLASMIRAIGGETRINYAFVGSSGHAFTEVNLGNVNTDATLEYIKNRYKTQEINGIRKDAYGNYWLNLDWFSDNKQIGGELFPFEGGTTFYLHADYFCDIFTNWDRTSSTTSSTDTHHDIEPETAIVNTEKSDLRVRSTPNKRSDENIIGKIKKGEMVTVLETRDGWCHIRYGNLNGWCSVEFLDFNEYDGC